MAKGFLGALMPALMGGGFHHGGAFTVPPGRVGGESGGELIVTLSTPSGRRPSWVEEAMRQHQADAPFIVAIDLGREEPFTPPMTIAGERYCSTCGCTQFDACTHPDHGACWWTGPNECSHCKYGWGDANGRP